MRSHRPCAADLKRWDRNHDGAIDADEYHAYFAYRLDHIYRSRQQHSDRQLPPLDIVAPEPLVPRAGHLPVGLPAWFEQFDTDHDGQVALYEWRRAGQPLDAFRGLDLNNDGFLEPGEILRQLALTDREGKRPYAYLYQKPVRADDAEK